MRRNLVIETKKTIKVQIIKDNDEQEAVKGSTRFNLHPLKQSYDR